MVTQDGESGPDVSGSGRAGQVLILQRQTAEALAPCGEDGVGEGWQRRRQGRFAKAGGWMVGDQ